MCQKKDLLRRLFVVLNKPVERNVVPYVVSVQQQYPETRPIYEAAWREDRHLTKREIERFGLMPPCGARFTVVEIELYDEWLRHLMSSRGTT